MRLAAPSKNTRQMSAISLLDFNSTRPDRTLPHTNRGERRTDQSASPFVEKYQLPGIGLGSKCIVCLEVKLLKRLPDGFPDELPPRPKEVTQATVLSFVDLEKLKSFDSCTISNAVERLNVRLRNEGFYRAWRGAGCPSSHPWWDTQPRPTYERRPNACDSALPHAYAHIVEFGQPTEIPRKASKIRQDEQELVQFCHSARFSLPELADWLRK
jgi:hypothetical protein